MKDDAIVLTPEVVSPKIPDHWDYDASVKRVRGYFYKWKNLSEDIIKELTVARKKLSSQGKRTDLTSAGNGRSWTSYCVDIGSSKSTVNEWLLRWKTKQIGPHVARASGENEWYTPPNFIEAARAAMGSIDTDPASSDLANKNVKAELFFTAEDDGLKQAWRGNTWMNPPYAQPLVDDFSKALVEKKTSNEIRQACVLVNNATETEWFQRMLAVCECVCFPSGRIKFVDKEGKPSGAPLQGQAILYFGNKAKRFADEFSRFGPVLWSRQ